MIEVNYLENNGSILKLEISGHANYDEVGKDIVCSAVSAIGVGGINALKIDKNIIVKVEKGYILIEGDGLLEQENQIVMRVILTQLKTIEVSYSKYLKVSKW